MRTRRERRSSGNDGSSGPPPLWGRARRTVRFQEADPMGVVWHGHYPEFLEDGRVVLGQAVGLDYADFFREGLKAPIVRLEIEYRSPLALGDSFVVETSLLWTEAVRLDYEYVIRREPEGRLIATAMTVQLLLDRNNAVCLFWPDYFQRLRKDWRQGRLGGGRRD